MKYFQNKRNFIPSDFYERLVLGHPVYIYAKGSLNESS